MTEQGQMFIMYKKRYRNKTAGEVFAMRHTFFDAKLHMDMMMSMGMMMSMLFVMFIRC